jgi:dTDP-4-dehydrorhamnose reductase
MSRFFVAGGGGMLGEGINRVLATRHEVMSTDINLTSPWLSKLDFRDFDEYRRQVLDFCPDWIFHVGAHTSLEYCEEHEEDAYRTNTIAVEYATRIANEAGIPIFYVSTAGIFDGKKAEYDDWDSPNPLGVYARSKYFGERFVVENAERYIVCRAGWMMGGGRPKDKKFINKLMMQLDGGARELFVVNDKDGTPTYTHDFVRTVEVLVGKSAFGLYNCVCTGLTSRFEVAQHLVALLRRKDVQISPVASDYFSKEYFAARPPSERLVSKRLKILGIGTMRDWRTALKDYLHEYYGIPDGN